MILNSKQLEELESIHDSASDFQDESGESDSDNSVDDSADSALAWRRSMLEKASLSVKKALVSPIDPRNVYAVGTLLYDRKAEQFCRVKYSVPHELAVTYLSGKTAEIRKNQLGDPPRPEPVATNKDKVKKKKSAKGKAPKAQKTKTATPKADTQKAKAPKSAEKQPIKQTTSKAAVKAKATPVEKTKASVKKPPSAKKPEKKPAASKTKKSTQVKAAQKKTLKNVTKAKSTATASKLKKKTTGLQKASRTKTSTAKTTPAKKRPQTTNSKKKPVTRKRRATAVSYSGISDPIADPNNYIQQHFKLMSNKELASVTGLSEHTIRRKLGEWGLKREHRIK